MFVKEREKIVRVVVCVCVGGCGWVCVGVGVCECVCVGVFVCEIERKERRHLAFAPDTSKN